MFVLGIDPGLSRCGYGVVEKAGRQNVVLAVGVLRTPHSAPIHERLGELQRELRELVVEFKPDVVAVERVFFQANASTAIGVAQAAGLAMAEAANAGCDVVEYTPNQVKEAVAGWGGASKEQIQVMVQSLLKMSAPPKPADAADALAVALCHLTYAPLQDKVTKATR
ncbi:MAG: crossover junction endodeoxyribonuclease RuvC [Acidimicrobiales bacterium]